MYNRAKFVLSFGRASVRIGRAFVASGLTTVAGFGVLALSGFPLLSQFGVVVSFNVVVALVCALVILPLLLAWTDHGACRAEPDVTADDRLTGARS